MKRTTARCTKCGHTWTYDGPGRGRPRSTCDLCAARARKIEEETRRRRNLAAGLTVHGTPRQRRPKRTALERYELNGPRPGSGNDDPDRAGD